MSNGVFLLVRIIVALLASAAIIYAWHLYWNGLGGILFGVLFSAPVIGVSIAKPLVLLSHEGVSWLAQQPLAKYQGRYYAFDGTQVRIEEGDEGLLFNARDVSSATGMRDIPWRGHGYVDMATVEKWLGKRREPAAGRFLLWARREVIAPWERKNGRA